MDKTLSERKTKFMTLLLKQVRGNLRPTPEEAISIIDRVNSTGGMLSIMEIEYDAGTKMEGSIRLPLI